MLERLTDTDSIKNAERRIRELIDAHGEWLYAHDLQRSVLLRKSECDFRVSQGRLIFSCWSEQGTVTWRLVSWEWTGEKLLLEASRRMGVERARLELIPRASVEAATAAIGDTRRERCSHLARLACAALRGAKVERASLSAGVRRGQPGRTARILLRHLNRERIAVAGDVAESDRQDVAAFLSSALIWFTRACERTARPPYIQKLWLIVEKDCAAPLGKLLALLREDLRRVITLFQRDDEWRELTPVGAPALADLWKEALAPFRRPPRDSMSESAAQIVAWAPEAIDVVRSRHGETLRYHGLPFARVRRVLERESIWFGIEGSRRRLLDETTQAAWSKLLRDLQAHRRADGSDPHHALYRASPEAWLESELRRDITRLDPGLRLAPLYAQFRPAHVRGSRPIDLLALRRDGRLVVIELKVAEDREHVLQGADYWRRTEAYRRHGHITRARLFGDAVITDEPPLVYLVAPMLRFHRSFNLLARAITPEIESYRFDINEDWRAGVRVMRRLRVS
ncbi:MAG: hypothetical protein QOH25_2738 [Acidobacteriota bacterium]|jgi:hypothetical protein|nr:hypothetical protein [Acidobacteriota bacterium]